MGDSVRIIKLVFKLNHKRNGKKKCCQLFNLCKLMSEADYQYTQ